MSEIKEKRKVLASISSEVLVSTVDNNGYKFIRNLDTYPSLGELASLRDLYPSEEIRGYGLAIRWVGESGEIEHDLVEGSFSLWCKC